MRIAIAGLGLIGGSMARAIKEKTDHTVIGGDIDQTVEREALKADAIDMALREPFDFDLLIIALYPRETVEYIRENAEKIPKGAVVVDCCGVKGPVCDAAQIYADKYGFCFVGGHPMAGRERWGFSASSAALFDGASMLLVPGGRTPQKTMDMLSGLFSSIGFGLIKQTTAQEHDRVIAYTSQLAHIVSSAYIKSPTARNCIGFSAGSFKDMTRVAFLNGAMWSELFLHNRDNLVREIDGITARLNEYRSVLINDEREQLSRLLEEGRAAKTGSDISYEVKR